MKGRLEYENQDEGIWATDACQSCQINWKISWNGNEFGVEFFVRLTLYTRKTRLVDGHFIDSFSPFEFSDNASHNFFPQPILTGYTILGQPSISTNDNISTHRISVLHSLEESTREYVNFRIIAINGIPSETLGGCFFTKIQSDIQPQ